MHEIADKQLQTLIVRLLSTLTWRRVCRTNRLGIIALWACFLIIGVKTLYDPPESLLLLKASNTSAQRRRGERALTRSS